MHERLICAYIYLCVVCCVLCDVCCVLRVVVTACFLLVEHT